MFDGKTNMLKDFWTFNVIENWNFNKMRILRENNVNLYFKWSIMFVIQFIFQDNYMSAKIAERFKYVKIKQNCLILSTWKRNDLHTLCSELNEKRNYILKLKIKETRRHTKKTKALSQRYSSSPGEGKTKNLQNSDSTKFG